MISLQSQPKSKRLGWLLLLILAALPTVAAEPLPHLHAGVSKQAVSLEGVSWYSGSVSTSAAFLTGTVTDVSSDVQVSPQQTWLSETCTLSVESAFGRLAQLEGISTAVLENGQEHSPYVPVEPEWGRLRHLQKGQQVLVLLHESQGRPSFGSEAVIELTEDIRSLPQILRRTAFQPERFTAEDMAVMKKASPFLHEQLMAEMDGRQRPHAGVTEPRSQAGLILVIAVVAGAGLGLWAGWRLIRRRTR